MAALVGVMRSPGNVRSLTGMPRAMMADVAGAGMESVPWAHSHFALPLFYRDRGHDAFDARGFHRQADEQRVADSGGRSADFMEVGLLDRAAECAAASASAKMV